MSTNMQIGAPASFAAQQAYNPHSIGSETNQVFDPVSFKASVADRYAAALGPGLKGMVASQQGIPQEKKEEVYRAIDSALSTREIDTPGEAHQLSQAVAEMLDEMALNAIGEAGGEAGKKAHGGGGNWLVALARALGEIAGKHLMKMVNAADAIGALSDDKNMAEFVAKEGDSAQVKHDKEVGRENAVSHNAKNAKAMAKLTAEMQAHGQMYKLIQEATTTAIKTVGEALHSTARKQ